MKLVIKILLIVQLGICMADNKTLIPLWEFQPKEGRYSIGWRMGKGEDYVSVWWKFYEKLSKDNKEKYRTEFPEPCEWEGFYEDRHPTLNLNKI